MAGPWPSTSPHDQYIKALHLSCDASFYATDIDLFLYDRSGKPICFLEFKGSVPWMDFLVAKMQRQDLALRNLSGGAEIPYIRVNHRMEERRVSFIPRNEAAEAIAREHPDHFNQFIPDRWFEYVMMAIRGMRPFLDPGYLENLNASLTAAKLPHIAALSRQEGAH